MSKKIQSYILHILGCLLFISIPIITAPHLSSKRDLFALIPFRHNFLAYLLLLVFFYTNYFYIIPRFYFTRRHWLFFLSITAFLCLVAFLPDYLFPRSSFHIPKMPMPPHYGNNGSNMSMRPGQMGPGRMGPGFFFFPMQGGSLLQFLLVFSLSFLLRINQRLTHIEKEKLKTEVSYLRAQINPHFLFNTLNSLYALTLEKSDAAPEAVLKLSSMMRYVVTESGRDTVALDNEISYIKNYISLQQLRMDGNTAFTFIVTGNAAGKYISPMLLIPFIENAFKYGLNPDEDAAIDIHIDITDNELLLTTKNNKVTISNATVEESGHGVDNTRQRLEYLYPNKHKLVIFDTKQQFEIKLTLALV